jgi:hypothetical protein
LPLTLFGHLKDFELLRAQMPLYCGLNQIAQPLGVDCVHIGLGLPPEILAIEFGTIFERLFDG